MKIVRIDGGLGNQMFCYAFAVALREACGEEVKLDSHRYKFFPNHFGYELPEVFDITLAEATTGELWKVTNVAHNVFMNRLFNYLPKRRTEFVENFIKYYPEVLSGSSSKYYVGNWQCPEYFSTIKDIILHELKFRQPLDDRNLNLSNKLEMSDKSVSIHVRRGDYLSDSKYCGICNLDYYQRAINKAMSIVGDEAEFVIFSNDQAWCKDNIIPLCKSSDATFVDWNTGKDSHKDMRLMSACRVNIIANSSFSWWGAYMNLRNDRHVIAPEKWINLPLEYRIQCDDWECI